MKKTNKILCYFILSFIIFCGKSHSTDVGHMSIEIKKLTESKRVIIDSFIETVEIKDKDIISKIIFFLDIEKVEPTTCESHFNLLFMRNDEIIGIIWISDNGNWGKGESRKPYGRSKKLLKFLIETFSKEKKLKK